MTVETEVNTETKRMSVSFTRKLGDNNYGSTEIRAWFEQDIPEDADQSSISEELVNMTNTAKAAVLDQLGVEVILDDTGVLREKHTPLTTQTAASSVERAFPGSTPASNIRIMNADQHPGVVVPADIEAVCVKHGIDAVWANNGKYGVFFKERVMQGEEPKLVDSSGKAAIIKPNM